VGPGFGAFLAASFNASQQHAIITAATAASHRPQPAAPRGKGDVFTLIKGPPGTGKTTTLKGLINALHLAAYSSFYDGVVTQELKKAKASLDEIDQTRRAAAAASAASATSAASAGGGGGGTRGGGGSGARGGGGGGQHPGLVALPAVNPLPPPSAGLGSGDGVRKPRLLVAAPSNIAVDNIISKVIAEGFVDGQGLRYNPRIVRVGRGLGAGVRDVSLEALVEAIGTKDERAIADELAVKRGARAALEADYRRAHGCLVGLLRGVRAAGRRGGLPRGWEVRADAGTGNPYFVDHGRMATQPHPPTAAEAAGLAAAHAEATRLVDGAGGGGPSSHGAASAGAPDQPGAGAVVQLLPCAVEDQPEYDQCLRRLVGLREQLEKLRLEVNQRDFALQAIVAARSEGALRNRGGSGGGDRGPRGLAMQLEVSILDNAHVIFTTLNSAASECFRLAEGFSVVVVDEAAQATEPATLVPLVSGRVAPSVVLVGDPQQLRATAFSVTTAMSQRGSGAGGTGSGGGGVGAGSSPAMSAAECEDTMLTRSLFERLEACGHPVHLLDTQYDLHRPAPPCTALHRLYKDTKTLTPSAREASYLRSNHFVPVFYLADTACTRPSPLSRATSSTAASCSTPPALRRAAPSPSTATFRPSCSSTSTGSTSARRRAAAAAAAAAAVARRPRVARARRASR